VTIGDRRRVVIEGVRPRVECGRFPGKASVGVPLPVSATLIADSTDPLLAWVWHGDPAALKGSEVAPPPGWTEVAMQPTGQDGFAAWIVPDATGDWTFLVGGLPDSYGAWVRDLRIRFEAGQDVAVELLEGAGLAKRNAARPGVSAADRRALTALAAQLGKAGAALPRLRAAERPSAIALMRRTADRSTMTVDGPHRLWVERVRAVFSAWYEMFPRSEGAKPPRSGTFRTASKRLQAIAGMGFDVVYLPPIHPIGRTNRKGRNNTLEADATDPGSPWAIGSSEGGHDAVDPNLGTLADFDAFVAAGQRAGLEVALDYALQCSPDHPWVTEHPQWFRHRPDGSIRYAENPPKRYQDIYPIDFGTSDAETLWSALRDVMLFWIRRGVHIFRVDNPHTKSFRFWEWLIAWLRHDHPEVILLSEAFTRPAVMHRLAKLGFSQSYTYFTWRNAKWELAEYLNELSQTEEADWFRPNFWVNTPDILHATLQHGGTPAFKLRAALAAITAPSWGMYSGYELIENEAIREGSEEYRDSEKYQLRPRDWTQRQSIAPFITRLNDIRRAHRSAISLLQTLRVHHVDNDAVLCVSRASVDRDDVMLLVVNLDPYQTHEATVWLDLGALGIAGDRPFAAQDELTGATYTWYGPANYVRLDPRVQPAHILYLRQ
jgi:starch synthase (maltosyl-transferring)